MVSALRTAIASGINNVLLIVGDVASRLIDQTDHSIAPIMGDGVSAIWITNESSDSFFIFGSDGSGEKALFIPNSGIRDVEAESSPVYAYGRRSVFSFTLRGSEVDR